MGRPLRHDPLAARDPSLRWGDGFIGGAGWHHPPPPSCQRRLAFQAIARHTHSVGRGVRAYISTSKPLRGWGDVEMTSASMRCTTDFFVESIARADLLAALETQF